MLIPTVLSVLFNLLTDAAFFTFLSYLFELGANVASIFKYHVIGKDIFKRKNKIGTKLKRA